MDKLPLMKCGVYSCALVASWTKFPVGKDQPQSAMPGLRNLEFQKIIVGQMLRSFEWKEGTDTTPFPRTIEELRQKADELMTLMANCQKKDQPPHRGPLAAELKLYEKGLDALAGDRGGWIPTNQAWTHQELRMFLQMTLDLGRTRGQNGDQVVPTILLCISECFGTLLPEAARGLSNQDEFEDGDTTQQAADMFHNISVKILRVGDGDLQDLLHQSLRDIHRLAPRIKDDFDTQATPTETTYLPHGVGMSSVTDEVRGGGAEDNRAPTDFERAVDEGDHERVRELLAEQAEQRQKDQQIADIENRLAEIRLQKQQKQQEKQRKELQKQQQQQQQQQQEAASGIKEVHQNREDRASSSTAVRGNASQNPDRPSFSDAKK